MFPATSIPEGISCQIQKDQLVAYGKALCLRGRELSVLTQDWKAGLVICWDLFFPEMFRGMVEGSWDRALPQLLEIRGCRHRIEIWQKFRNKLIDSVCVARGFWERDHFVYCSAAGRMKIGDSTDTLTGHSQIAVSLYGVYRKISAERESDASSGKLTRTFWRMRIGLWYKEKRSAEQKINPIRGLRFIGK